MLKFEPTIFETRDKVSSKLMNENNKNLDTDMSELIRQIAMIAGENNVLSDMIIMVNKAMTDTYNQLFEPTDDNTLFLTAKNSDLMYPEDIRDEWKAHIDDPTNLISLNRLSEDNQFSIWNDQTEQYSLKERVAIDRLVEKGDDGTTYEVKGSAENIFISDKPYIITSTGVTSGKMELTLGLRIYDKTLKTNTIRFIPFPGIGKVRLNSVIFKDVDDNTLSILEFDDQLLTLDTSNIYSTIPIILAFRNVDFKYVTFIFSTEEYIIEDTKQLSLGIQNLDVLSVQYSHISYVGFKIDTSSINYLSDVEILGTQLYDSVPRDYINFMFYDDLDSFNFITDDWFSRNETRVNVTDKDEIYLLVELNRYEDVSPLIKGIKVTFTE